MSAKSLMVMGTASDVGKSVVTTALCRAFARRGIRVTPFKAQNMSNNAAVCPGGGEIGRAQAVQAEACGLQPDLDMNPVLLKPEGGLQCQVVIHGRARFRMRAGEDQLYRAEAWPAIVRSYQALASKFELVVIEGAGSAAEINLRDRDIVNWPIAQLANAPVLLVADIDKGGVFAALVGTIELLTSAERARIKGFLINKFRGELALLEPGLQMLEQRTRLPVLGVIPYQTQLGIPQEDSAHLDTQPKDSRQAPVRIGVIHLPRISNYTDFQPLENEPDVVVHYLSDPLTSPTLDLLILPGTKSTAADLEWLRSVGWEDFLARHRRAGGWILGICGGYQMLGQEILDPDLVEAGQAQGTGLAMLPIQTIFHPEKITELITAVHIPSGLAIQGYEIHAGRINRIGASQSVFRITKRGAHAADALDGAYSEGQRVMGTSIHGIFDRPAFRRRFIDDLRKSKGLPALGPAPDDDAANDNNSVFDRIADVFEAHVDMSRIAATAGLSWGRHGEAVEL